MKWVVKYVQINPFFGGVQTHRGYEGYTDGSQFGLSQIIDDAKIYDDLNIAHYICSKMGYSNLGDWYHIVEEVPQ